MAAQGPWITLSSASWFPGLYLPLNKDFALCTTLEWKESLRNVSKTELCHHLFLTGGLRAARAFPENLSSSFGGFHPATVVVWSHTCRPSGDMCDCDDDDDDDDIYFVASSSPPMQRMEFLLESNVFPEQTKQLLITLWLKMKSNCCNNHFWKCCYIVPYCFRGNGQEEESPR